MELLRFLTNEPVAVSAQRLLGCEIVTSECRIKIVETEAYGSADDPGSHGFRGETPRTRPMFGPAGHAYVYFTYGNHWMLNVTCRPEGESGAVLIRGAMPIHGAEVMRARRTRARTEFDLLSGPGKIAQSLALEGRHSGLDLLGRTGEVRLVPCQPVPRVIVSTRIGLAAGKGDDKQWRYVDAEHSEWASRR